MIEERERERDRERERETEIGSVYQCSGFQSWSHEGIREAGLV